MTHNATSGGHIHLIPVDRSMTAEEAWRELCIFGQRVTYTVPEGTEAWASIACEGECHDDQV